MRSILFPPDLESYGAPDRRMPGIYARVGRRLAEGANITSATQVGDSASNMMVDADEDYNTRYGGYRGYVMAYERVKLVPRHAIELDLVGMLAAEGAETSAEVIDRLARRFLHISLEPDAQADLVAFLEERLAESGSSVGGREDALRAVLYLVLSTPEYQLG